MNPIDHHIKLFEAIFHPPPTKTERKIQEAIERYENEPRPPSGPRMLPIITIGRKQFYVDPRLRQCRNVTNGYDYFDFR